MGLSDLLGYLAANASLLIALLAAAHFALFMALRLWWTRALQSLQDFLEALLRNIPGTSDRRRTHDLDDEIEDFLQDVRAILTQDHFKEQRHTILTRVIAKKEQRPYLRAKRFERWYNVARSCVEIYPLAGILGTILAMAVALSAGQEAAEGAEMAGAVTSIVGNFSSAIWSTFWGLVFAIFFMGLNAWYEPSFARLIEYRTAVREAVREAERGIVLAPAEEPPAEGAPA